MKYDDKIKKLMAVVEDKRKALGKKPRASWNTNAVFRYNDSEYFNLNTVQDPMVLVKALAFLLNASSFLKDAGMRLGVEDSVFEWNGYSLEDWEHDLLLRTNIMFWAGRKKELDQTEKKLKALISDEAKTGMELAELEKLLS